MPLPAGSSFSQTERDDDVLALMIVGNDAGVVVVVPIGATYLHCSPSDPKWHRRLAEDI